MNPLCGQIRALRDENLEEHEERVKSLLYTGTNMLDGNAGLLSNYEVLAILKEKKKAIAEQTQYVPENLATVTYENEQIMKDFMLAISKFKLTKAEKLMLLNQRPTSLVELHLIIEETEERFSEEESNELLQIIDDILPPVHPHDNEDTEDKGQTNEEQN
ncbi:uncharacterized protein TRIADDRAFT_51597 [Trichoplax adhaerens]|uniref:DNA-directed RNA polymerase III subunit RPC9 n=1 Tax=Trichoplax adhaerens TaxID=10228 RepID=B3RK24_TRIAD|nr:hypothetical protein TRIADDRAFT_51597 [Trichoplax adhaerens]EDV28560.1 hypothetical protein TRIADDRAFT_51597 [Trichoplax adhaerens]|eukprot:XP_002107762.1 hypothetical protein TRIADDRAFT_51597 [Trichoplax adhaerens]